MGCEKLYQYKIFSCVCLPPWLFAACVFCVITAEASAFCACTYFNEKLSGVEIAEQLVGFFLILANVYSSFFSVMFTDPGTVTKAMVERIRRDLVINKGKGGDQEGEGQAAAGECVVMETKRDGTPRHCPYCKILKPDRTHHCHQCNKCHLRMDHHCKFLNNCIGLRNHKAFLCFLGWACITGAYIFFMLFNSNNLFGMNRPKRGVNAGHLVASMITSIAGVVIAFVLFIFGSAQFLGVLFNYTTLEFMEKRGNKLANSKPYINPYYISLVSNFLQVFESNPMYWFFPVPMQMKIQQMVTAGSGSGSGSGMPDGLTWTRNTYHNHQPPTLPPPKPKKTEGQETPTTAAAVPAATKSKPS